MTASNAQSKIQTEVTVFVKDLLTRSLHTAWQTALAVAGTLYASSGLNISELTSISGIKKLWVTVVCAIAAAVFAAVKNLVVGYVKSNGAALVTQIESTVITGGSSSPTTVSNALVSPLNTQVTAGSAGLAFVGAPTLPVFPVEPTPTPAPVEQPVESVADVPSVPDVLVGPDQLDPALSVTVTNQPGVVAPAAA